MRLFRRAWPDRFSTRWSSWRWHRRKASDRLELAKLARFRKPPKGSTLVILASSSAAFNHFLDAFGRKIRRVGRTRTLCAFLPRQDTDSGAARSCFLQVFDLLHADADRELLAFRDGAFGIARATGERLLNGVGSDLL